jgi:C-terminal peptidase prc
MGLSWSAMRRLAPMVWARRRLVDGIGHRVQVMHAAARRAFCEAGKAPHQRENPGLEHPLAKMHRRSADPATVGIPAATCDPSGSASSSILGGLMVHQWRAALLALVSCVMALLASPGHCAPTDADTTAWTYEAVSASPRWSDFVKHVRASHLNGDVDVQWLADRCRTALKDAKEGDPVETCVHAVLLQLGDQTSQYVSPKAVAAERAAGPPYVGIGLELGPKKPGDPLPVVAPIEGGPAFVKGIRRGDLIIEIDGVDIRPLTMDQTVGQHLRGPVGSRIVLKVLRDGALMPLTIAAFREEIRVLTVVAKRIDDEIGYLRIRQFGESTHDEFLRRADTILGPGQVAPKGLLVDLRSNTGGLLDTMVLVGSVFAEPATPVVVLTQRSGSKPMSGADVRERRLPLPGAAKDWLRSVPLVVLVNERSASGAEALAQFLREHRKAQLVGRQTLGIANLQQRFRLGTDAAVTMLTGELSSPGGVHWMTQGLAVDIETADSNVSDWGSDRDAALKRAIAALRSRIE